jgi:putative SOS response-associated peptidase YedK
MCNRYAPPRPEDVQQRWLPRQASVSFPAGPVYPRAPGPFIRARRGHAAGAPGEPGAVELLVGQWALVPDFARSARLPYSTNNARFEALAAKASYRQPWARGQRCIIPAAWFDEPCWETGRNVWWRFRRADGQPWALAGLWNTWVDPASGELVESYTMLTLNADAHPLMRRMHRPEPALPPERQDKRSVVVLEATQEAAWLQGTTAEAAAVVGLAPVEVFHAAPVVEAGKADLFGG